MAGAFADPAAQAFYRDAAAGLLQRGALRVHALRVGEEIVAAFLGFFDKKRLYCYLTGFDPRDPSLSAGTLILAHAIEEATAEGAVAIDFLRGDEGYKRHYRVSLGQNQRRRLSPAG
jgi:CelD/BcsL family acetyltransferase involved in cellulose biosynthesis